MSSPAYISFHPNPSKPSYQPPAGAVDAHCHVFGPHTIFPFAAQRKYTPCDAPKETLFALRDFLGFEKSVIVQATCHNTDNRALVDALNDAQGRARGVAFVEEDISNAELNELDAAGVRGVRFNFIKRLVDSTPKEAMQRIATRVADLGWHIVIYFEQSDLEEMRSFLESLPTPLVFDHMACPNVRGGVEGEAFQNWLRAVDANEGWINKVTCPERFSVTGPPYDDVAPFARALVDRFGDRVLWGTDWPHPNMKDHAPDDGALTDLIPVIARTAEQQRLMLVDTPAQLYWR